MGTSTFLTALLGACLVTLSTQSPVNETHPSKLIMGGSPSQPGAWPSWVSIVSARSGRDRCGGTLISNRFVLTAAHCVLPPLETIADYVVAYGTINPYDKQNSRYANIKEVIVPREYNSVSLHFDVAILELAYPIQFDLFAQRIDLSSHFVGNGQAAVVVGFGPTAEVEILYDTFPIQPASLQQANVNVISNDFCQRCFHRLSQSMNIMPSMMCAGTATLQGGTLAGTLPGDSGGPLYAQSMNGDWFQIGIVSFGASVSYPERIRNYYPSGFTRISAVCPFIYSATRGTVRCGG